MKESVFKKLRDPDKFIFFMIFLMLIERIIMFFIIGPGSDSHSDDIAYLASGPYFAKTGIISVWEEMPTALIMPAMPVITGLVYMITGEGLAYIVTLKVIWITLGLFTPWFIYKMVSLFLPKWYGILAAASFFMPNIAWMDNLILTETPYLLFFTMSMYYTFCMGESKDKKYLIMYCVSFLLAICFRANIVTMPLFTAVYLLLKKTYNGKELLKRLLTFACASMIFFVPWTIRNYIRFGDFIPVSYGAADPTMWGTYQGEGFPTDEELDYQTNVIDVLHEEYAEYYNEDGTPKDPNQQQYLSNMGKSIAAKYRISEWIKRDPASFIKSFFFIKPYSMLNWPWYWGANSEMVIPFLKLVSKINCVLCALTVLLSLIRKKQRLIVLFLSGMYVINIYIIAMAYISERYSALFLPIRYMISVFGIWLIADWIKEFRNKRKTSLSK